MERVKETYRVWGNFIEAGAKADPSQDKYLEDMGDVIGEYSEHQNSVLEGLVKYVPKKSDDKTAASKFIYNVGKTVAIQTVGISAYYFSHPVKTAKCIKNIWKHNWKMLCDNVEEFKR